MRDRWYYVIAIVALLSCHPHPAAAEDTQPSAPISNSDSGPELTAEQKFLAGSTPVQVTPVLATGVPVRPTWLAPLLPKSEQGAFSPVADDAGHRAAGRPVHGLAAASADVVVKAPAATSSSIPILVLLAVVCACGALLWFVRRAVPAVVPGRSSKTTKLAKLPNAKHGPEQPFTVNIVPKVRQVRSPVGAQRGFSIMEVMVSVAILSVALMGMLSGITTLSSADQSGVEAATVREAAQNLCERLQGASWHQMGIPSEPWSWYRRATLPPGAPLGTDPYTYWSVWNPLTVPNPIITFTHAPQVTYYNPPITLTGSGARSIFVNQGQFLVDASNHQIMGPTGLPISIQEIIVVDCALEIPPPAVVAAAQAQWSSNSNYTPTTPVVGLGIFHSPPGLANLRIYLEYFNTFPVTGNGNSIFQSAPGVPVVSRTQFSANCGNDNYRLAVPIPSNPTHLVSVESPDDFTTYGLGSVTQAIGIRVMFTWDSCIDTPPDVPLYTRPFGTRTQTIILERRQ